LSAGGFPIDGIDPEILGKRAEQLSPEAFQSLARELPDITKD